MRPWILTVLACLLALGLAAPAGAEVKQRTYTVGPIEVSPYQVVQNGFQGGIPKPDVDGAITRMDVDLVDARGKLVPIQRLMLHHIVFSTLGSPIGSKHDSTCKSVLGLDNVTSLPGIVERFYAAGEERAKLDLPAGYGYPVGGADTWGVTYMVMNHRARSDRAFIRYRVTYDTEPAKLTPVRPVWMDVGGCKSDPIYDVRGGGKPGSEDVRTAEWTVPQDSRVVAANGHVHGGGLDLELSVPECDDRALGEMLPTWGLKSHPFYNVKPVLHEPGPVSMRGWTSAQGMPIKAGQTLRLTSTYDAERPHTRVMGISIAMLAPAKPGDDATGPCPALPTDRVYEARPAGRRTTPKVIVPLTGLDKRGRAVRISRPPGKLRRYAGDARVRIKDYSFSRRNLAVPRGATVDWSFEDDDLHDVTLASGPRGFSSPHQGKGGSFEETFDTPGTYKLFCSLHPVAMTERIVVGRRRAKR